MCTCRCSIAQLGRSFRRAYSMVGGMRSVDLQPPMPGGAKSPKDGSGEEKKQLDSLYTGRLSRWVELDRVTTGWDMSQEHRMDLLRAMMMGLTTRNMTDPADRIKRRLYQRIRRAQAFDAVAVEKLGPDLAAAMRLIAVGCRVAFVGSAEWLGLPEGKLKPRNPLPLSLLSRPVAGMVIEGVDARDALLMPDAADWLGRLRELRFLRLRRAPFVDDSLLARLAARCVALQVLDLSACPNVTWEGIASLWRLRQLRRLVLSENSHLANEADGHLAVPAQLEALLPGLFVEGVDDLYRLAVDRAVPGAENGPYAA